MKTLLFIPALLNGDMHGFMTKVAVVIVIWILIPFMSSLIDLATGIAASKRLGTKRTTSWGLRRTLSKDLQYFTMLFMLLLMDIGLSALSEFLPVFSIPLLSVLGSLVVAVIEFVSIMENNRKGKNPEEDKMDDVMQLASKTVEALGTEKTKEFLQAVQSYYDQKKH